MASLAGITVVVEGGPPSGSLITAEMALDVGRRSAPSRPVTSWRSSGTNRLLADAPRSSATPRTCSTRCSAPASESPPSTGRRSSPGRGVLDAVEAGATTGRRGRMAGVELGVALSTLGVLERAGYVKGDVTGRMHRTALRVPGPASAPGARRSRAGSTMRG